MAGFLLAPLRKCAPCGNVQTGKTGCRYEGEKKYGLICMEGEMDYQSMFTFMLEMAGTIAFAASGAMVGAQRGMDIFGV